MNLALIVSQERGFALIVLRGRTASNNQEHQFNVNKGLTARIGKLSVKLVLRGHIVLQGQRSQLCVLRQLIVRRVHGFVNHALQAVIVQKDPLHQQRALPAITVLRLLVFA